MAGRFDGKVFIRKSDMGAQLRRVGEKAPAPKGATLFSNGDVDALLAKMEAAKLPFAPYSCFIPGVSPTGDGKKAVAHTMAQVKAAIKKGFKPVLCYANFGGACLMLLEDKPMQRPERAKRPTKTVEYL